MQEYENVSPPASEAASDFSREKVLWSVSPSYRALIPSVIMAMAFMVAGFIYIDDVMQWIVNTTYRVYEWTDDRLVRFYVILWFVPFLPLIHIALRYVIMLLTRYELTDRRLRIHHGLIVRRHDEIALHRIRDYIVKRPILGVLFGYGNVRLVTRDPSMSSFLIRDIADPKARSEDIRMMAYAWKQHIGYREFDTGELN